MAHIVIQTFIGWVKKCNFSFWSIQVLELPQNWQTECSLVKVRLALVSQLRKKAHLLIHY